ncbi:solute carrier family 35 member [Musa troglodytarum]|uniref:Solute carrier family 35 member n=1 Tax=Musa troglodytarum TaxID=320322 RepID=A0A9E7K6W7_9LILI|nr:solute carrier family 35 member [Musa troglodytarum]
MNMEKEEIWRLVLVLFLGQLVSFFLAVASFTSSLIAELGTDTPLTQSFFTYLSLSLVYGAVFLYRRQKLLVAWYWYLVLAFVDVQGNYFGGTKPIIGDILVIAGTFCYAFSNVSEISLFVGFAASAFLFYTIVPFVLKLVLRGATVAISCIQAKSGCLLILLPCCPLKQSSMNMEEEDIGRLVVVLFLGQLVSFLLAVASFTSSLMADLSTDTPLTQSFLTYLFPVPSLWCCVPVPASEASVIKDYQYSSITSVTLLNCWAIPWIIILTWPALGARICVLVLGLVLLSNAGISGGGGMKPIIGDILVIAGTFCFAFSNVGEEYCVKKKDLVEVVTMLGIFGVLLGACEMYPFQYLNTKLSFNFFPYFFCIYYFIISCLKDLESVKWSATMISLFVGFTAASLLSFTIIPFVLKIIHTKDRWPSLMQLSGATLFSLSLLTSDIWALVIRIFFYRQQVDWLYYLAFGLVAVGLIIYIVKLYLTPKCLRNNTNATMSCKLKGNL